METHIIATAAGLIAAGHTTGFLPAMTAKLRKSRLPDGYASSISTQQHAAPPDWFFDGFRDENGDVLDPRTDTIPDFFTSFFDVSGYVQAVDSSIKVDGIDFNFVMNGSKFDGVMVAEFNPTRQGGIHCRHTSCGYSRLFHSCGTHQDVIEMIRHAKKTQQKIRVRGDVRYAEFADKKLQKIHFAGFDQYNSCPVVQINSVEIA